MSSTDDASSRLSNALEAIFSKAAPTADWSVDDEPARPSDEATEMIDATEAIEATAMPEATEVTEVTEPARVGPGLEAQPPAANGARAEPAAPGEPAEPDDVYVLPEIVPATVEPEPVAVVPPPPVAPVLPPTTTRATPAVAPPAPVPAPAPTPAAPAKQPATSWADHLSSAVPTSAAGAALRAPGRRPRVRRVTRVLRHVDPWSTFKVGLLFSAVAYVVVLTAGVLLWQVADSTGTLDNVERWFTQFGWETFQLKGGEIFHNAWIIGLFGVVAFTGGLVLLATLFNLVSDIVGGVRVTVLEEEVVERTISSTRRYVVRRPPLGADAAGDAPAWDVDDDQPPASNGPGGSERPPASGPDAGASDWSVDDDDPAAPRSDSA